MTQQTKNIKTHFLDASALAKLYLTEVGSDAVRNNIGKASVNFATNFCISELIGIIKCKWLYAKANQGGITKDEYLKISYELMGDIRNGAYQIEHVDFSDFQIFNKVEAYCSKHNIDLVDSLQLFTLLEGFHSKLEGETKPLFITADKDLAKAARTEGLAVWLCNKEDYPEN
jgi:hypothetical protein